MFFQRTPRFVVDLGSRTLKAVQGESLGKLRYRIRHSEIVDAPSDPVFKTDPKTDGTLTDLHRRAIADLVRRASLRRQYAVVLLPDFVFLANTVAVPAKASEQEKEQAIRQEIGAYLPAEAERAEWVIEQKELPKVHTNILVFLAMIKSRTVLEIGAELQRLGVYPVAMDMGLLNAINVFHDYLVDPENNDKNIGVMNFGHVASSIAIFKNGTMVTYHTRGLSTEGPVEPLVGGRVFTRRIMDYFKLSDAQAEAYKREEVFFLPEFVPEQDKISNYQVIKPVFGELVKGLYAITEHYQASFREFRVDEVIMTGGGANFNNIDVVLGGHLNTTIRKGSTVVSIVDARGNELADDVKNVLIPALGGFLRDN